jgi:hypothetical protein
MGKQYLDQNFGGVSLGKNQTQSSCQLLNYGGLENRDIKASPRPIAFWPPNAKN